MKKRDSAPDHRFVQLVREVYWLMRATIDTRLDPMGLSHALWRPLLVLHGSPEPMTQTQLAQALGVEAPTVVRQLDRLAARGWIARRNCPHDRRAYHVELTEQAQAVCNDIERVVAGIRQQGLAGVGAAELATTIRVLEKVRGQFERMQAQPATAESPRRPRRQSRS